MSINDSIFAAVGRPHPVATAVRIPIQGAFNTLVVVHLRDASVIPGIMTNNCDMLRVNLSYPSNFVLVVNSNRTTSVSMMREGGR